MKSNLTKTKILIGPKSILILYGEYVEIKLKLVFLMLFGGEGGLQ